uniref:DUF4795 domain-containing protein n=1 Tax=Anopheles coluzzii TaxID=1518534 RepID=A0A8W7PA40_ANOCL
MAANTTPPTCSELLAEAFGDPEPGSLNFTSLQQLLQALLTRLNLQNVPVDQVGRDLPKPTAAAAAEQTDPVESPVSEVPSAQTPTDEEDRLPALEQAAPEPIVRFEDTEAYHQLLAAIEQLQDDHAVLKGQLQEQTKVNKAILPSAEQLEEFSRSRISCLQSTADIPLDFLTLAARLDKIDESIGKLTALANDTVLEYARLEKSVLPYLDGGELIVMRAQLDNINQLLKAHYPSFRAHCSTVSILQRARPVSLDAAVPIDFYQHSVPSTVKSLVPRRSTIKHQPGPDLEKELDAIRGVLTSLVARLPLPEQESCLDVSHPLSSTSLELSADNLRAIWPRELDELLRSCNERIEVLEKTSQQQAQQLDSIATDCTAASEAHDDLRVMFEYFRESISSDVRSLELEFTEKFLSLVDRLRVEQTETSDRLDLLDQQMENRVEYEHFRTRLSKETFAKTIGELQGQIDTRVEHFSNELERLTNHLKYVSTGMLSKPDKAELERLESRMRHRLNFIHLVLGNIRSTLRNNVEAAGAKIRLGPEPLRCVSCNHETTMRALEELIPTGKSLRCAEKQHQQRVRLLNKMALRIAGDHAAKHPKPAPKPKQGTTAKANMQKPEELAYKPVVVVRVGATVEK